jgi:hypothetical protein
LLSPGALACHEREIRRWRLAGQSKALFVVDTYMIGDKHRGSSRRWR